MKQKTKNILNIILRVINRILRQLVTKKCREEGVECRENQCKVESEESRE